MAAKKGALRKDRVSTAKPKATGAFYVAPLGTKLPTDATSELDPAFMCLGYVKDDGVKHTIESNTEEFKAWGGEVVHRAATEHKETVKLSLLQNTADSFRFLYGSKNVEGDIDAATMTVKHNAEEPNHWSVVVEIVLSDGVIQRKVVPDGQPSKPSEISYTAGELINYETEITAYADAAHNYVYDYYAKTGA